MPVEGYMLSEEDRRIFRQMVAWWRNFRGAGVTNTPGGAIVNQPDNRTGSSVTDGYRVHFAKITSSADTGVDDANGNPVQWTYQIQEVAKESTGYTSGAWATLSSGYTGTAYHMAEYGNDGTGRQINGVDHDGSDYPAGFAMQPLQDGAIVPFILVGAGGGSAVTVEAWILPMLSAEDGSCS